MYTLVCSPPPLPGPWRLHAWPPGTLGRVVGCYTLSEKRWLEQRACGGWTLFGGTRPLSLHASDARHLLRARLAGLRALPDALTHEREALERVLGPVTPLPPSSWDLPMSERG